MEYAIENDGFLYINQQKEKVENLLTRHGLQLSAPLKVSNSNTIIRENSEKSTKNAKKDEKTSKNSLEQQSTYVDSEGRELTKEQAEYFKDVKKEIASAQAERNDNKSEKETTDEKSVGVDASSARYSIKQFDSENYDFEKSTKTVANMAPVVELKGNEFVIGKQGLYDEIVSYFNTINNNAYNEELGDIELKRRGIKDSVAHGLGELKTVAFRAIPSIIEKGKVVDYQKKWKGREYDTAVIAAPINIAGEEYYAVVVVRRTQVNQRFYLHEIDIKKDKPFKPRQRL